MILVGRDLEKKIMSLKPLNITVVCIKINIINKKRPTSNTLLNILRIDQRL